MKPNQIFIAHMVHYGPLCSSISISQVDSKYNGTIRGSALNGAPGHPCGA